MCDGCCVVWILLDGRETGQVGLGLCKMTQTACVGLWCMVLLTTMLAVIDLPA